MYIFCTIISMKAFFSYGFFPFSAYFIYVLHNKAQHSIISLKRRYPSRSQTDGTVLHLIGEGKWGQMKPRLDMELDNRVKLGNLRQKLGQQVKKMEKSGKNTIFAGNLNYRYPLEISK